MRKLLITLMSVFIILFFVSCAGTKDLTKYGLELQTDGFYYIYSTEGGYALYVHNDRDMPLSDKETAILSQYFEELKDVHPFTYPYLAMIFYSSSELSVSAFLPDDDVYLCYYYNESENVEIEFAYNYEDDKILGYKVLQNDSEINYDTVLQNARLYYNSDIEGLKKVYNADIEDWF